MIKIFLDDSKAWVKPSDLPQLLESGWQLAAPDSTEISATLKPTKRSNK